MTIRDPLQPLSSASPHGINAAPASAGRVAPHSYLHPVPSSKYARSSRRQYIPPSERKLAPIFTRRSTGSSSVSSAPSASAESSSASCSRSVSTFITPPTLESVTGVEVAGREWQTDGPLPKRARLSWDDDRARNGHNLSQQAEHDHMSEPARYIRGDKVTRYLPPSTPTREGKRPARDLLSGQVEDDRWVVRRRRTGLGAYRRIDHNVPEPSRLPNLLPTLKHRSGPFQPGTLPQTVWLPSLHPPTGRARWHAPALAIAFNHAAKTSGPMFETDSESGSGRTRMLAVGGEEGGVRIIPVDQTEDFEGEKGYWWRAHGSAIFDVKWSGDDTRILTGAGDTTARVHQLTPTGPVLIASLQGHSGSVKTVTFFDPRGHADTEPSGATGAGDIIATGARDGNIMIHDLRCVGRAGSAGPSSPRDRARYSVGVEGFEPQHAASLEPVLQIRNAHRHASTQRGAPNGTLTSLVALKCMPGTLASGSSADGIVKLWDIRSPAPTTRYPHPRPHQDSVLSLPDPTIRDPFSSLSATINRRARARCITSIAESPLTGDLYILTGEGRIHTVRPGGVYQDDDISAILPAKYGHTDMRVDNFEKKISISPDGRYLAAGSGSSSAGRGSVMTWDISRGDKMGLNDGFGHEHNHERDDDDKHDHDNKDLFMGQMGQRCEKLYWDEGAKRGSAAVDWGMRMIGATMDDYAARIWRSEEW